jgi:hypothetical protein
MEINEFGRDPAVRAMRRVFASMENVSRKILQAAALPPFDRRLRLWREQALKSFELAWVRAGNRGLARDEGEAAALYALCLAGVLERAGVAVPAEVLPRNEALESIVKEIVQ